MLAEHSFITTREFAEVAPAVASFLVETGFNVVVTGSSIRAKRWRYSTSRLRRPQLPFSVEASFDRGRVNLAVGLPVKSKRHRDACGQLTQCLVQLLEHLFVHGSGAAETCQNWKAAEEVVAKKVFPGCRRGCLVMLAIIVGVFVGLALLVAIIEATR